MSTTMEEAKECPKCGHTGEDRRTESATNHRGKPVEVHYIYCVFKPCKWFNTPWQVMINPDGSIPEPYSQLGPKQYPSLSPDMEARIRANIEQQLENEQRASSGEAFEIRNPRDPGRE
jgi:hypothetical protein